MDLHNTLRGDSNSWPKSWERPTGEEIDAMMKSLDTDSPRGAAMVATAIIEDVLSGAIRYELVELTKDEDEALFGVDRPLGTFSSRINIAYALGIIGGKTRHDLDTVRNVRNAFAHEMRDLTFDTKEIAALCRALNCIKDIEGYRTLPSRALFAGAVRMLTTYLLTKIGRLPPGYAGVKLEGTTELD